MKLTTQTALVLSVGLILCPPILPAETVAETAAERVAETVVVHLQDGRHFTGTIQERSNAARLWIEYGTRSVTVIRPVDWEAIDSASFGGESISVGRLKEIALRSVPDPRTEPARPRVIRVPPAADNVVRDTMADRARRALGFARRIRSVDFDAALANWDGDVENDGLLLQLYPIDEQGYAAAAGGTLEVEFIVRRRHDFNDVPGQGGSKLGRIGRWTVRVDERQFQDGVAIVKLPFQAVHPEFDTDWFPDGLVHVRYWVAGHGTFEHSIDGVRVRPFSPLRDTFERQSGRRFLPTERTGRGKRSAG